MKVLLIHNYYRSASPSGEDIVFDSERKLLQINGIHVTTYTRFNDDLVQYPLRRKAMLPLSLLWSRQVCKDLRKAISDQRPDVVHFHNLFYLISPSAFYACKEADVPVVHTLHNFRMSCVNGLLLRNGAVCEDCLGRNPWRGVVHGCYRNSRAYSLPLVIMSAFHRAMGTWNKRIDAYIALTEFARQKYTAGGLSAEKILVKPNFLADPPDPAYSHKGYAIFIGRLSAEKGMHTLLEAVRILPCHGPGRLDLKIVGDGPLKRDLQDRAARDRMHGVVFMGRKSHQGCMALLKDALFLVIPSVWFETFCIVVAEAFACGKPVVASRLGALAELIEDGKTGLLFEPGNPEDLASKMKWMAENGDACVEMGRNARRVFEEKYTAEKNFEMLMNIYQRAIENSRAG